MGKPTEKKSITPKLVEFETQLLDLLKDEALSGPEKLTYRGHVNPLINEIVREHYRRKQKGTSKKVHTMADDRKSKQ